VEHILAEFYYTASVEKVEVDWQYIGTVTPSGTGFQDLLVSYELPKGGSNIQAVRVNVRYDTGSLPPEACPEVVGDQYDLAFTIVWLPTSAPSAVPSATVTPTFMPDLASYDDKLGVPYCAATARGCSTGDLFKYKGESTTYCINVELNSPNTLDGCIGGNLGSERVEKIFIESLSGDYMTGGSLVTVTATLIVWSVWNSTIPPA
jgi:hypothetical protein